MGNRAGLPSNDDVPRQPELTDRFSGDCARDFRVSDELGTSHRPRRDMAAGTQRSSSKKRSSGSRGGGATGSRPRATRSAAKSAARRPSANGASANGGGTVKPVVTAVAGAAAGALGGVILGRKGKKSRFDG